MGESKSLGLSTHLKSKVMLSPVSFKSFLETATTSLFPFTFRCASAVFFHVETSPPQLIIEETFPFSIVLFTT